MRLSYADVDTDPAIINLEIIEENNYYPFGLKMRGINETITSSGNSIAQKWKYNGIELEQAFDFNVYEMDLRQYDPALARWTGMDPVLHESMSPYNAFDNNPVYWADPSGADGTNPSDLTDYGGSNIDGEYELIDGEWKKTSTKGDNIGVDFYHTDSKDGKGNDVQKTYVTDRKGNWNIINNGRYALEGKSRDGDDTWSTIYNEFLEGNGPERSVFEGDHQSIVDIKKNYLFENAAEDFEESGDSKGGGEVSFWPIWDNIGVGSNMQVQMMGSFNVSFYRLGEKTLSLVQDSKSRTSYYYHLPVVNYPRSSTRYKTFKGGVHYNGVSKDLIIPHKQESTTYQTYIFFR